MFENYTVIGFGVKARRALRVTSVATLVILAGGASLGLWLLLLGGDFSYRGVMIGGPIWGAALAAGAVATGFAMRGELQLAFSDPTLVSGTDVVGGILLTQRRGPGKGTTAFLPARSQVVLVPVRTAAQRGVTMYGIAVATPQGSTLLDLSMKPAAWDIAPAEDHLSRHAIQLTIGRPQDAHRA